jgi:DNA-directed RNA polymerase specialized sigma24 family protein
MTRDLNSKDSRNGSPARDRAYKRRFRKSLEIVFLHYNKQMEALIRRLIYPALRGRIDSAEITRSVERKVASALAKRDRYKPEALWGLIVKIARAKVKDYHQKARARKRDLTRDRGGDALLGVISKDAGPDKRAMARELESDLYFFLAVPEARAVVRLWLEKRTKAEIVAAVGCTTNYIRVVLRDTRQWLTERLQSTRDDG